MKVEIDPEQCEGHGRCVVTAPEVFRLDADGWGQVIMEEIPDDTSDELRAKIERAIRLCPKQAIAWVPD